MEIPKNRETLIMHNAVGTIVINLALSAFKMVAGIVAASGALISDAVHSLSDVLSTFVVMVGVKIAGKEPDEEHPYGHERLESAAAIVLAVLICVTGLGIGADGVKKIMSGGVDLEIPGRLALIAAFVSIVVKEGMFWYTKAAAKKAESSLLLANAWHHRSDALSSVGSFVGVLGARLGVPVMDPIASVLICAFIVRTAYQIFMEAIRKMTDEACDKDTAHEIRSYILSFEDVHGIDRLRTRQFGERWYVDADISVDSALSLVDAHAIAERVHKGAEAEFPKIKHCMVHVNPCVKCRPAAQEKA
ncbi:cation diffusion facilitator family transporter [Christensenellaceae bacterium OttesenSCG-928-L17]|nr:cation diffusion facilitator family transporter [Christensenellaceae bacterium OttesenSCG-928-L17]